MYKKCKALLQYFGLISTGLVVAVKDHEHFRLKLVYKRKKKIQTNLREMEVKAQIFQVLLWIHTLQILMFKRSTKCISKRDKHITSQTNAGLDVKPKVTWFDQLYFKHVFTGSWLPVLMVNISHLFLESINHFQLNLSQMNIKINVVPNRAIVVHQIFFQINGSNI